MINLRNKTDRELWDMLLWDDYSKMKRILMVERKHDIRKEMIRRDKWIKL